MGRGVEVPRVQTAARVDGEGLGSTGRAGSPCQNKGEGLGATMGCRMVLGLNRECGERG